MTIKELKGSFDKLLEEEPRFKDFVVTDIEYCKRNGDIHTVFIDVNNEDRTNYATISLPEVQCF